MEYSDKSMKRANRLIVDAIDNYDEFMGDHMKDGASPESTAKLGLIMAGVALANYRREFGAWETLIAAFRCWKVSKLLEREI